MAEVKKQKKEYIAGVGRRRAAIARVRLYPDVKADAKWGEEEIKKGEMLVNGKQAAAYFGGDVARRVYTEPLRIVNAQNKYAITVCVIGGGPSGQLEATVHGLSRVLSQLDPEFRKILKTKGFLTRDARVRERRKVGTGGKARRHKQSPKR